MQVQWAGARRGRPSVSWVPRSHLHTSVVDAYERKQQEQQQQQAQGQPSDMLLDSDAASSDPDLASPASSPCVGRANDFY